MNRKIKIAVSTLSFGLAVIAVVLFYYGVKSVVRIY